MDPSWYYNRLSNASAFPPSSGANASEYHQQLTGQHSEGNTGATPPSTSHPHLQFNAGFSLPNPYPFYGIPHASKTLPYAPVGQNRALATTTKPSSEARENYNPAHNQSNVSGSTYFDHQTSGTGPGTIGWPQHNSPLATASTFGMLPHESITPSSTSPKTGQHEYPFNAYSPHNVNHLMQTADYKGASNYSDGKKSSRSQSPCSKNSSTGFASYPTSANIPNNYAAHESSSRSNYSSPNSSATIQQQQPQSPKDFQSQQSSSRVADSNLYQEASINRNEEATLRSHSFSTPGIKMSHPTKAQSKHYSDVPNVSESSRSVDISRNNEHNSSPSQRYASDSKQATGLNEHISGTGNLYGQLSFPYHYSLPEAAAFNRLKSMSSELYLATQPNGDCGKKASSQSQPAPAPPQEHVRSSFGVYNNPVTTLPNTSPQQHSATSVITRAAPDPALKPVCHDNRHYERMQDQATFSKQCWESGLEKQPASSQIPDSSSHHKKYPTTSVSAYDSSSTDMTSSHRQQPFRNSASATDKQNSYYDNSLAHQAALQNLSSYRDDPMSIIKDLQNYQLQQNHDSSKSGDKSPVDQSSISSIKKRKSAEKHTQNLESSDFYNRVPPPAHNNVTFQQQQSGSYFPNFSPPSSSRSYPVPQVPVHYASHAQALMGQHQGLYSPPFFPLPGPSSAPTSSASATESTSTLQTTSSVLSERVYPDIVAKAANNTLIETQPETVKTTAATTPKVVVPNVEEELSFLKDAGPVTMMKSEEERKNSTTSGFEASFLKFLQGERETSPPPSSRSVRKSNFVKASRTKEPQPDKGTSTLSNGDSEKTAIVPSSSVTCHTNKVTEKDAYDPKDDPRYFPLPKNDAERQVSSDSDSDNGPFSSIPVKTQGSKSQERKPVAAVAPRTTNNKQVTKGTPVTSVQPGKRGRKRKSEVISVPRRETSKRKAKEKGSVLLDDGDDEISGKIKEHADSDSDPAWTPMPVINKPKAQNLGSSDEEITKKKYHKKNSKLSGQRRKRFKHSQSDDDAASSDYEKPKKQSSTAGHRGRKRSVNLQSTGARNNSGKSGDDNDVNGDDPAMSPFKVGDFIVMKTDLVEKWPPIWRVDGKTLLQKFEPFDQKGAMLYRNISTYSGWSPQNSHIYKLAHVVFKAHNKSETVVEFVRDEMADDDDEALMKYVGETEKFQDNFEVYIQTLISQALDSNFLTEIFQEKDDYFLSNVKTVDDIVDDRRKRFLQVVNWRPELEASIATWPCYDVINEISDDVHRNCAACDKAKVAARVLLYGQPYNSTTLEGCQPDFKLASEKDFFICRLCLKRIELYNKVAHQKYLMYIECSKRVNERKQAPSPIFKDTTVILNELLADDVWLNQLFRSVRISWAQIDRLEHSLSKN